MQKKVFLSQFWSIQILVCLFLIQGVKATSIENGKDLFLANCNICHLNGNNIIIPEKSLKKDALEENGMNTIDAISYQILNGKNGMPAFGGRLKEVEIEAIANYVLQQSLTNFQIEKN